MNRARARRPRRPVAAAPPAPAAPGESAAWHPMLARQIEATFGASAALPPEWTPFLDGLSALLDEHDRARMLAAHEFETLSLELRARNARLERELSERARLESELHGQAMVLAVLSEGVLMTTAAGRILEASPAAERILGRTHEELLASRLPDLLRGASAPLDLAAIRTALQQDGRWQGDLVGLGREGADCVFETVIIPVEGVRSGECWAVVLRDITARILLERQLFQAQKLEAIGSLAAGVAHEINTPSQYVADNLTFLQEAFDALAATDGAPGSDETRAHLLAEIPSSIAQSLEGLHHIAKIVRSVKRFAHPGGGSRTPLDLNAEIESAVTVSRNEWKYAAEVELDLAADLPRAACYPGEIGQVVLNLLVNAAHAIEQARTEDAPAGRIRIGSRREGDHVVLSIADNGSGIPESVRARIFDPFFTTKPVGKGTGQGLAICHRLVVEKHGGGLTFETREGAGTTFFIRLPIEAPPEAESLAA